MAISEMKNPNPSQEDMKHANYRPKNNSPHIVPIIYPNEKWLQIIAYPELQPWYYASDHGRIYSRLYNTLIRQRLVGRGYRIVTLRCIDNTPTDKLVHRLVMDTFNPIQESNILQVNHIDCRKINNFESNLEWSTNSENMIHAYQNSLYRQGQDNNFSKLSNSQVHEICRLLEQGYSIENIVNMITLPLNNPYLTIKNIYIRKSWKHISKDYTWH